ncbi:MAG: molybdopterin-dependent oxidoreductase [Candidatus Binatia bacterium]
MTVQISRRMFLQGAGAAVTLSLLQLGWRNDAAGAEIVKVPWRDLHYGSWDDLYRDKWKWDKVIKGAHSVINCASACPFNLYVKDGIVLREEQNTVMDAVNDSLPDFNPRGCQKGICFSQLMYDPNRVRHPFKRVGERGAGKWKRISWDAALTEIADKIIEVAVEDGPECVVYDNGTANAGYGSESSEMHLFNILRSTQLDGWAAVGDMPLGVILTMGLFNVDSSSDDYFHSDLIFLWLGNPSYTRIPDAHFLWEARYNGTKVVSVAPDYNASTMHCDQWLNVRVGTDAALAMGMAQVIVSERLYKPRFVKEQTDMPLLVRGDNGFFLRQSDLEAGGKDNVFYLWDRVSGKAVAAPSSEGLGRSATLKLKKLDPALEGTFTVALASGEAVSVRPVFELLKERLADYTPEKAAAITGVNAEAIRETAREFSAAKAVSVFGSWGMMKHHHSDLFQRAIVLLLALTGNTGRRGTGLRIGAWYMMSGVETIIGEVQPSWWQKLLLKVYQPSVREMIGYFRDYERDHMYMNVPALMFLYQHGGLDEVVDRPSYHDENPGLPLKEAMKQCVANEWVPSYPRDGKSPRFFMHTRVNPLRRWPAPQLAKKHLWPKFDLIVGLNIKMSTTCLLSDIVLPGAGYYERRGIKYAQSYVPYYVVGDKAVEPVGEARNDWEIAGLLAKKIQQRAREKDVPVLRDAKNKELDLKRVYDAWTKHGVFDEKDDLPYYDMATRGSPEIGGIPWSEAVAKGAIPIKDVGPFRTHTNICSDYEPGKTVYSSQWFVEKKMPWPTLTGRMQFYLDHDWYLKAGEQLPIHKEPPRAGGNYPLRLTGGHTRWSIHSTFADQAQMLQLQRGEPLVVVGVEDAAERGIEDGSRVRVYNDVGSCELIAKLSSSLQPGQVVIYHAWEPHCFKDWQSNQEPVPSPWKSLHMTEYGQLHYRFLYAGPHHTPRGTTVELRPA